MKANKLTVRKIKKELQIKSWKNIPIDKLEPLKHLLLNSPKTVACKVICKFPNIEKIIIQIIPILRGLCKTSALSLDKTYRKKIKSYSISLNRIEKQLNKNKISTRRKRKIIYKLIEIMDYLIIRENDPRKILSKLLDFVGGVGIVISGLTLLISLTLKFSVKTEERIKHWFDKICLQFQSLTHKQTC